MNKNNKEHEISNGSFLSPLFLIRVGGLPSNLISNLSLNNFVKMLKEKKNKEAELSVKKSRVDKILFDSIQSEVNDARRKALLKIKREINKNKIPKDSETYQSLLNHLDFDARNMVKDCINTLSKYNKLIEQLPLQLDKEIFQTREHMQDIVKNIDFQNGILLSSEPLYKKLMKYINIPINEQNAKMRKIEKSLMSYISRMATKTSPFSTFTPVNFGIFNENTGNKYIDINDHVNRISLIRVNYLIVLYLIQSAEKVNEIKNELPLKVNKTLKVQGQSLRFFKNTPSIEERLGKSIKYDESFVEIKNNSTVMKLIEIINKLESPTKRDLLSYIYKDATKNGKEQLELYIDKLINIGILEANFDIAEDSKDILQDWYEQISLINSKIANELSIKALNIQQYISDYSSAPPEERILILQSIKKEYRASCNLLGVDYKEFDPIIFEDTSYDNDLVKLELREWTPIKDSLTEMQNVYNYFSTDIRYETIFKDFFIDKFGEGGECDDILQFLDEFFRYSIKNIKLQDNDQLKKEFHDYIYSIIKLNDGDSDYINIEENWLRVFNRKLERKLKNKQKSNSYFLQPFYENKELKCVVNRSGSGFGQFMSRFDELFPSGGDLSFSKLMRETYQKIVSKKEILAEVNGVFGFNANLHSRMTEYRILYPGIKTKNLNKSLRLENLKLSHSVEENQLYFKSEETGKVVLPLYLGFLSWFLLPSLYKLLFIFVPNSFSNLSFTYEYYKNLEENERERIIHIPEIRYKNLILSRQQWWIPVEQIPISSDKETDIALIEKYLNWIEEVGISSEVFLTLRYESSLYKKNTMDKSNINKLKPQYIDFKNLLLIKEFEKMVASATNCIVLEDLNPEFSKHIANGTKGDYNTEFVIEVNQEREEEISYGQ